MVAASDMWDGPSVNEQGHIDGRVARAERLRDERRSQILSACRRVFARDGYHQTSIRGILAEAGIARGTFYAHFDGKQAALDVILTEFLARITHTLRPVNVDSVVSNNEQLRGNVMRALGLFEAEADLARLVLHQATGLSPELDAKLEAFYAGIASLIQRSLDTGHSWGIVRHGDRQLWSRFIVGALKEVASARLQAGEDIEGADMALATLDFVLPAVMQR